MKLHNLKFDRMNEADIREEFIAPLVAELGYQSGGENRASREVPLALRYPRFFLGNRNKKTDPYVRGRADYVLEVDGHARWVIEAKPPREPISEDHIEQAWSYANHPEVRAVYFAISNGREFRIYRTNAPPGSNPILQLTYEQIVENVMPISQLLSAEAIARDFPATFDTGLPLGPGLRSMAMIASGTINYSQTTEQIPLLTELQIAVVDGAIERGESGNLVAYVVTLGPIRSMQIMLEKMGLNKLPYISQSFLLSTDSNQPTEFIYQGSAVFSKGEEWFDMTRNSRIRMPFTVNAEVNSRVLVYLSNGKIAGTIENVVNYTGGINKTSVMSGEITLRVI